MKSMGINWTTLNINLCQEKVFSRKLFLDFKYTVTDSEIVEMTKLLHENGVRVILKPCLTSLDGASMYRVTFPPEYECRHIEGDFLRLKKRHSRIILILTDILKDSTKGHS